MEGDKMKVKAGDNVGLVVFIYPDFVAPYLNNDTAITR